MPDRGKLAEDPFVRADQAEQHGPRESRKISESSKGKSSKGKSSKGKSGKGKSSKSRESRKSRSDTGETGKTRCD
jgi:hypothetical protein